MAPRKDSTTSKGKNTISNVDVEPQVDLVHISEVGVSIMSELCVAKWIEFFERKTQVHPEMIRELWRNKMVGEDAIESKVMSFTVMMTIETIAEAINCPNKGLKYDRHWAEA